LIRAARYSQILVKASAERSYLLSKEQLRRLVECKTLNELAVQLQGSPYESLLRLSKPPSAVNFQRVFKEDLVRVYNKMMAFSPKRIIEFLGSYLRYLEIENLKVLIKLKNAGVSYGSILNVLLLSIEEVFKMKERFIRAAKAKDVNGVIEAFKGTVYDPILSEGLKRYEETGLTKFFDFSLDRTYHDYLLSSAESLPREEREIALLVAGLRVDVFNIVTAIRSKFLGYPPHLTFRAITRRFFRLSEKQVRNIVSSSDIREALAYVRESFYGNFLTPHDNIEEFIKDFERKVNHFILRNISRERLAKPFTIAVPLEVMLRKEIETKNLVMLSSGIEFGWNPKDILSMLL